MKKYLGIIIGFLFVICPLVLKAAEEERIDLSKYNTLNLIQTLEDEEIAKEFSNYEETDNQVTIYMFRGKGCGYCRSFLNFLNSITTEYGAHFKLVSFETWYDTENADLLDRLSTFMGQKATGVPYIIIGDQVFPGYSSSYDDSIKSAITSLSDASDKYDVIEEYNKSLDEANRAKNAGFTRVIIWNLVFITIATIIVISYVKKSNERLFERMVALNNKKSTAVVKEVSNEEPKAVKKPAKKKNKRK